MADSSVAEFQINQLPLEIVINIFEYLSFEDLQNASLTCKKWFDVAMHSTFVDRRVLCLEPNIYLENDPCYQEIGKPILSHNSFKFMLDYDEEKSSNSLLNDELLMKKMLEIFEFLSQFESIFSLEVGFELQYDKIMRETLCCLYDSSFMADKSFNQLKTIKVLRLHLLIFQTTCYLSYFLELMPELEHIDIQMDFNKEFCSFCEKTLHDYIAKGKNRLKTLILSSDLFQLGMPNSLTGMNLITMSAKDPIDVTDPQKLRHLHLSHDVNIDNMNQICQTYSNLESLFLSSAVDMKIIKQLKKLTELSVWAEFDDQWINNFSKYNHKILKKLLLLNHNSSSQSSNISLKNLINLTHITLWYIRSNDDQMQEIFEHLKHLQYFVLLHDGEHPLTDYGFTGERGDTHTGFSISNLLKLKLLHIEATKGFLGEPTLKQIMKIKRLEYLYIRCNEDEMSDEDAERCSKELRENCPLIKFEKIDLKGDFIENPNIRKFNKLLPLNGSLDDFC